MISLLLPGTTITYNGDELGMEDSFTRWDQTVDPQALGVGPKRYLQFTRDGCRSPFQWDSTINSGETDPGIQCYNMTICSPLPGFEPGSLLGKCSEH
ncbi:hypothetical protein WDU94_002006 [Cyamophila willieti]